MYNIYEHENSRHIGIAITFSIVNSKQRKITYTKIYIHVRPRKGERYNSNDIYNTRHDLVASNEEVYRAIF